MVLLLILLIVIALLIGVVSAVVVMKNQKKETTAPADSLPEFYIEGSGGVFDGQCFALTDMLVLGRLPDACQICYPPDTAGISGLHCRLWKYGDAVQLTDLGSSFGTFVNHVRVEPDTPVLMHPGDSFCLAETENMFIIRKTAEVKSE